MKRKILAALLALALLLPCQTIRARAAEIITSGNCGKDGTVVGGRYELGSEITFTLDNDGVITFTGCGEFVNPAMSLPWAEYRSLITKVVYTEGLTKSGTSLFSSDCQGITDISFPESMKRIDEYCFSNCTGLTSITLPASLEEIGHDAFYGCKNIKDVYYGGTLEQWNQILIRYNNEELTRANLHTNYKPGDPIEPGSPNNTKVIGANRAFGGNRYDTAFKAADLLKEQLGIEKFEAVVVADGLNFADALSGSYLAAVKNAPILLVRNNKTTIAQVKDYITKNLNPGGTVYLLGGENAIPKSMESGLDGFAVKRLGGANRYDTNLLILKEAGVDDKDILICTGKGFADSLSASAAGLPILLVKDSLNDAQKEFLKGTAGRKYIIGGASAVSAKVENAMKAYGEVSRLGGNTRYETSVLVAKAFFEDPTAMVVAYAQNFPDGLSGGALAAGMKAPLILTANGKDKVAAEYAKFLDIKDGYILGGPTLISDKTVKNIFSADSITVQ